MMSFLKNINPALPLRLGLGLMFLYSGTSLFNSPDQWLGFVPGWFLAAIESVIPLLFYLRIQGIFEIIIGLLFIAWFSGIWGLRIASFLAAGELFFILTFTGLDAITFRDIGLLGAALALFIIAWHPRENSISEVTNNTA